MDRQVRDHELTALVREVIEELQPLTDSGAIAVTLDPRGRARIAGSRDGITRAVANVVQNAIEHSPPGHDVQVRVATDGSLAIVDVHDDGPGVPEPVRERVFEPFYTTRSDGAGLGLAVTEAVVRAHGGRVRFLDSTGCTVRIELPRLTPEAA